ncbi:hypothetical protein ACQJBY_059207 [Aegilops geniculata]
MFSSFPGATLWRLALLGIPRPNSPSTSVCRRHTSYLIARAKQNSAPTIFCPRHIFWGEDLDFVADSNAVMQVRITVTSSCAILTALLRRQKPPAGSLQRPIISVHS